MPFITRFLASQMRTLPPLPDVDLTGKVYIITGANSGIGLEIAKHLIERRVSHLIFGVRDIARGETAKAEALLSAPQGHEVKVDIWELDLARFSSVNAFAERCETLERLDGVAMNAGMLGGEPFQSTEDGHEVVTQVNVLSPTYLAILVKPSLEKSAAKHGTRGRIIFTGSAVAEVASTKNLSPSTPLQSLDVSKRYNGTERYNQSKLVLHCMVRQMISAFPELVITDVNPGFVETPLYKHATGPAAFMVKRIGRKAEVGARNVSFALATLEKSTDWYHDCRPCTIDADWLEREEGQLFGQNLWNAAVEEFNTLSPGIFQVARRT